MEPIPVTATELRTRARELIERVHYYHECYRVETFGRPMAIIISCEAYEELQALLNQQPPVVPPLQAENGDNDPTTRGARKTT